MKDFSEPSHLCTPIIDGNKRKLKTDNGDMYHVYLCRKMDRQWSHVSCISMEKDGQTMESCIMYIYVERWTDNGVMYHVYLCRKMDRQWSYVSCISI